MDFCDIPINTSEIPQSDLNIDIKKRVNLFSWNGQFSPQFVEVELNKYAHTDSVVIDPFAGSGTTLCEAARKGLCAYGIELNPSAYHMAKTYELVTLDFLERNSLFMRIDELLSGIKQDDEIISSLSNYIATDENDNVRNVLSTLVILMDIFKNDVNIDLLNNKWEKLQNTIVELPYSTRPIIAINGDARETSLDSDTADILLTSPPYINVFNYHQNYRQSVEALGYDVLNIAKSEFGSNRKHRGNRFLTVIQYCIDMAMSLKEAIRICKKDARMIYVIGRESTVLGYSFCNSELIYRIATDIFKNGFDIRQERVFKNRYGQMIYEDILHFLNMKESLILDEEIKSRARKIAVEMLFDRHRSMPENKNADTLLEAVKKADAVNTSEVIL